MASTLPPVKNAAFTFDIALVSQADTDTFKTSPTLAAGDVLVSLDGDDFANIDTLPSEIQTTGVLSVALTADEMNADRVTILFHDAAGAEWQDAMVTIYTAGQTLDTTDGIADDVKSAVDSSSYGLSKIKTDTAAILADTGTDGVLLAATQGAITWGQQKISASKVGEGALHITNSGTGGYGAYVADTQSTGTGLYATGGNRGALITGTNATGIGLGITGGTANGQGVAVTGDYGINVVGTTADIVGDIGGNVNGSVGSVSDVSGITDAVWDEAIADHLTAGTTGLALHTAGSAAGTGTITFTYTLTSAVDGTAIEGAIVEVYSDSTMSSLVATGLTNSAGQVIFYLDAGTYYLKRIKPGWSFINPDEETVA